MDSRGWRSGLLLTSHRLVRLIPISIFSLIIIVILTAFLPPVLAARKGVLWVKAIDTRTSKPVAGVEVTLKGTAVKAVTDKDGEVGIELTEGEYTISLAKANCYNSVYPGVKVEGGKATRITCEICPGNPKEQFYFGIGGIDIVDKRELLPEELETTHEISGADIEHHLSTNLGDVLTLVPGVERTKPPGLSQKSQVEFRGTGFIGDHMTSEAALFGTQVIIDDIRISNNANLQTGDGTTYGGLSGPSTVAGSGIDLRTIPADNIEKVEVVTGVPSVEYGDLTSGLVKVQTKTARQPHRLKIKSNPDTKEGNLSGGWEPRKIGVSYNLNYAYSERDIRRDGDEYSRYSGQLTVKNRLLGDRASLANKFFYTGVIDEIDLDSSDPLSIEQSNKDKTYLYGLSFDFAKSNRTKLFFSGSVQYTKRDSYRQGLVAADTRVLTDSEETGTTEGDLSAGAYLSKIWTRGEEWTVDTRANFRKDFDFLTLGHSFLVGGEYSYNNNVGQGKIFNPYEPPGGNLGKRPLPFDASPALYTASAYLQDEMDGILFKRPWIANLGLRYEMYRPTGIDFGGLFGSGDFVESKNGSFNNPRIRLRYDLFKDTRIRLGWGKTSKMPSMTTIFQGPEYIDVVEENVSPPDSVPLVSTYVFNFNNSNLRGYQNEKAEVSLDQKVGSVALILTPFYSKSEGIPRDLITPITLYRYQWTGWPDMDARTVIDTIFTQNDKKFYENRRWSESWGVEGQIVTKRIKKLSTLFNVSASFVKNRWGADGLRMESPRTLAALGGITVYPFYHDDIGWRRKLIVNYQADWFFKSVGMWTTFFIQQTLFDADQNKVDPYLPAAAYYDPATGRTVPLTPAGSDSLGLTRTVDELDLIVTRVPNDRFLFNINVTKSLTRGAEISFFVHNLFDDAAFYLNDSGFWVARNHDIFYGVEVSLVLDELFKKVRYNEP